VESVIITLDQNGLIVCTSDSKTNLPTNPRTVYDITGAGDMVLATLGLCLLGGIATLDAARIANIAAGLDVERFGIDPMPCSVGRKHHAWAGGTRRSNKLREIRS